MKIKINFLNCYFIKFFLRNNFRRLKSIKHKLKKFENINVLNLNNSLKGVSCGNSIQILLNKIFYVNFQCKT